jgi:hypothetical protein
LAFALATELHPVGGLPLGFRGDFLMSIALWLPVLFVLGVVTIGLMLAFIVACERV